MRGGTLEGETAGEAGSSPDHLFMDGAEIFNFTLSAVPQSIHALLEKSGITLDDVDLFVFHQANRYMLDHLRKRLKIPAEKFQISMAQCGNTVSSTIPIALHYAGTEGRLQSGKLIVLVGFGVGLSWGATLVRWV
jgi:3-oxoacyl-[acyl-carrier-protein] synthase-3